MKAASSMGAAKWANGKSVGTRAVFFSPMQFLPRVCWNSDAADDCVRHCGLGCKLPGGASAKRRRRSTAVAR